MTRGHFEHFTSTKEMDRHTFRPMARQKSQCAEYKRADRPEQKDERKQAILKAAAAELALISSAKDFTISALARRAGLAKGTVYLYFNNKSAILMTLLGDVIEGMLAAIIARLTKIPGPVNASQMAKIIQEGLKNSASSQRLVRLLRSLSEESGRAHEEFRIKIDPLLAQMDELMSRKLPALRPDDGRQILRYSWAFLFGLSEMMERNPRPKASLKGPRIMTLEQSLEEALTMLIEGYIARSAQRGP